MILATSIALAVTCLSTSAFARYRGERTASGERIRSAPQQAIRLSRHIHLAFNRSKRHGLDK
jgi:hypothetical protein